MQIDPCGVDLGILPSDQPMRGACVSHRNPLGNVTVQTLDSSDHCCTDHSTIRIIFKKISASSASATRQ